MKYSEYSTKGEARPPVRDVSAEDEQLIRDTKKCIIIALISCILVCGWVIYSMPKKKGEKPVQPLENPNNCRPVGMACGSWNDTIIKAGTHYIVKYGGDPISTEVWLDSFPKIDTVVLKKPILAKDWYK